MHAMQLQQYGGPLVAVDLPIPVPKPGEVLVKITACGVNFADTLLCKGTYQRQPQPPFVTGMEFAGIAVDTNTRVAGFCGHGAMADYITVPKTNCLPIPENMSNDIAAGFLIAYGSVHLALARRAQLTAGETLVVLGARGGSGRAALDIGRAMGARLIACTSGAPDLLADVIIDPDKTDLRTALLDLGGVDVVFDTAGGDNFTAALRATRPEGRLIPFGFASGTVPEVKLNHLLVKNLSVIGVNWGNYPDFAPNALNETLAAVFGLWTIGAINPPPPRVMPLSEANTALELLGSRRANGKIVLRP